MRNYRDFTSTILYLFLATALLISCTQGVKKSFLVTQSTFNDAVEDYSRYYEGASSEKQTYLKENVHPKVIQALTVMHKMNEALRAGTSPSSADEDAFRELRYDLYKMLPNIFGKEN